MISSSVPFATIAQLNLHSQEAETCQIIYLFILN